MAVGLARVPVTPGTHLHFSLCCLLNDRSREAHSFFKIGHLFSLSFFSCPSLAFLGLLILLLLLMSGNVHPNPGPIFLCSVCAGNVTWRGKSVQCCACSKWVHLKCKQPPSPNSELLAALTLGAAPPLPTHCDSLLGLLRHVYLHCTIWAPPLLTLHSHLTLVSKPLIPHLPIIYLLPLPSTTVPCSWLSFYASYLLSPHEYLMVLQWNAGGLRARSTELLHFLSSHPVDLICIQESILNSSSSFRILGFSALRSDRTHSWSDILSSDVTHASGGVVIFVRQGLSFSELSTSSLSSLDPYSDYIGINISLDNSSSLSFLNVYAPLFAPPRRMTEPNPFLPPFFPPPEISSFWGTSIAISPSGTQEILLTPTWRKYSTGSTSLTSSPSMTLTHPPFSIAPLLKSLLLPLLVPFLAHERCLRTWV